MMNQGHKILNLVLIFGLAIVFTITTVFNFIAGALGPGNTYLDKKETHFARGISFDFSPDIQDNY